MSIAIGTPLSSSGFKVMMLGSGELGKEVVLELQRFGVEVIAVDRYVDAPAMQVAHRQYVIDMLDGPELRKLVESESPNLIIPEIEAIATQTLVELEKEGFQITKIKMMDISEELAKEHYGEHSDKPFFNDLVSFITSGPVVAMQVEGDDVVSEIRRIMGATNPSDADPGTIRADLALFHSFDRYTRKDYLNLQHTKNMIMSN